LRLLRRAGAKAATRCANPEASVCFEQALGVLPHLPQDRATLEQAVDLRIALRNSLLPLCEFGRVIDLLREADALAVSLNDPSRRVRIACYMSNYFWLVGDHDAALEASRRASSLAGPVGDVALEVAANFYLAQALHSLGDYAQAIERTRQNATALADIKRERF